MSDDLNIVTNSGWQPSGWTLPESASLAHGSPHSAAYNMGIRVSVNGEAKGTYVPMIVTDETLNAQLDRLGFVFEDEAVTSPGMDMQLVKLPEGWTTALIDGTTVAVDEQGQARASFLDGRARLVE